MGLNWDLGSRVSLVSDFPKLETLTDKNLAACLRNDQPITFLLQPAVLASKTF